MSVGLYLIYSTANCLEYLRNVTISSPSEARWFSGQTRDMALRVRLPTKAHYQSLVAGDAVYGRTMHRRLHLQAAACYRAVCEAWSAYMDLKIALFYHTFPPAVPLSSPCVNQ